VTCQPGNRQPSSILGFCGECGAATHRRLVSGLNHELFDERFVSLPVRRDAQLADRDPELLQHIAEAAQVSFQILVGIAKVRVRPRGQGTDDTTDGMTKIRRFKKEKFPQILVSVNMAELYPDEKPKTRINWASQIAPFVFDIQPGDWVVVPHKHKPALAFGEVSKAYAVDTKEDHAHRHSVRVKWLNTEVPRSAFDQDLLYSFGAFMTVCRMARNDSEARVRAMAKLGWKAQTAGQRAPTKDQKAKSASDDQGSVIEEHFDVERSARDQITKLVLARFKGHGMAELVGAILRAQGFSTHISPSGPDGGIDILAAPGTFGFAEPRICVQV
jgi:predicted Mrr-cat superfamily restriction endonuclease